MRQELPRDCRGIRELLKERSLPAVLEENITRYIAEKTGKAWNDPVTLNRLRGAIQAQKSRYWREGERRRIQYQKGYDTFAYLAYHLPVYHHQVCHLLGELLCSGEVPRDLVLLDGGCGPGVVSLGAISVWSRIPGGTLALHAIERSPENREAYGALVPTSAATCPRVTVFPPADGDLTDPATLRLPEGVDLLVLQNVLNEWICDSPAVRAAHIQSLSATIKRDGRILLVEPAEKEASVMLRKTVSLLAANGWCIRGPCPGEDRPRFSCRQESCWSFEELPPIRPTALMRALGEGGQRFRFENADVKFSWALLARERRSPPCTGRRQETGQGPGDIPGGTIPLRSLGRMVGHRVAITARKISADLGRSGDAVFSLCDGTQDRPVYAILPRYHQTRSNSLLAAAPYTASLLLEDVLVRYNPRHAAFNLLVTRGSAVRVQYKDPSGWVAPLRPILSSSREAEQFTTETRTLPGVQPDRTGKGNRETHHLHPRHGPRRDRRNPR